MEIKNIHLVYFSATFTTRRVLREIARVIGANVVEHDFTCGLPFGELRVDGEGDLLVVGAPVYAGRLPVRAARTFGMLRGTHTPAVAVCVYGNRDYDDALVEEQDIIEANGFKTVAAGAFIGRHCIFPKVAAGRPDAGDMRKVTEFASRCADLLGRTADVTSLPRLNVKVNVQPRGRQGCVQPLHDMRQPVPHGGHPGRFALDDRRRQVHSLRAVRCGVP